MLGQAGNKSYFVGEKPGSNHPICQNPLLPQVWRLNDTAWRRDWVQSRLKPLAQLGGIDPPTTEILSFGREPKQPSQDPRHNSL